MPPFLLPPFPPLPVVEALPRLLAALDASARVVLEAPPGAGKTTLVPLALLNAGWRNGGKILVLEPRQLAVRGAAARLAQLLGEPVGRTVGYRVRLESNTSAATRIEVITEGILTRMVQDDPALEGVAAVVFDEFHERSLNADLGLALALDVQSVLRDDLRILLMSATLQAEKLGAWLPGPVVSSAGFLFPIDTHYLDPRRAAALPPRPRERLAQLVPRQVRQALETHPSGDILVFLPGQGDLQRVQAALAGTLPDAVALHLLHGELPLEKQQDALRPAPPGRRKVILSTSIAETSLTIEGVAVVIDSGFSRVPRYVPRTGFSTLETVPVSQAEADQRRGRAGRLGPGTCYRLYTEWERETYPRHRPPEILTAELSGLVLETAVWGAATPAALRWPDAPPAAAVAQATDLLVRLGAVQLRVESLELRVKRSEVGVGDEELEAKREAPAVEHENADEDQLLTPNAELLTQDPQPLTLNSQLLTQITALPHGRAMARLGLPPRLAHLVLRGVALGYGPAAARLAALLAERDLLRWAAPTDTRPLPPDLRLRLEALATGRPPLPGLALHQPTLTRVRAVAHNLAQRLQNQPPTPNNQTRTQTQTPNVKHPKPNPQTLSTKHQALSTESLAALAYPERLAQRETPDRLRLATGQRVALPTEEVDAQAQFFAVAHLTGEATRPRVALAAALAPAEIELLFADQIASADEVTFDPATGRVTGRRTRRLGALLLAETALNQPDPALVTQALLAHLQQVGLKDLNWTPAARQLQQRLQFLRHLTAVPAPLIDSEATPNTQCPTPNTEYPTPNPQNLSTKHQAPGTDTWPDCSDTALLRDLPNWLGPHLTGLRTLDQIQRLDLVEPLLARLPGGWPQRQELDRLAPAALAVPSGSLVRLSYDDPAQPVLAVKLQELFGLTETPAVAAGRVPLLLHLLSPGGQPAQVTQDLRSFWEKGYFEVRKDLKNRYPRHPWPDKPMEHIPTRLTKKRLEGQ